MKFSIIIPTYKYRFLQDAIESVFQQTFTDFELLIVDDCSPEDIKGVVNRYADDSRLKYIKNDFNYGAIRLAENWNNCLRYCQGDYVICMGDDDLLLPHCLENYNMLIDKFPNVDVLHGQTEIINEKGKIIEYLEPRFELESVFQLIYYRWVGYGRQQFIGDFCFKRKSLIEEGGFYNLPLAWGSDDITACIMASKNGIANTEAVCFQYRKNSMSISSTSYSTVKLDALLSQQQWYEEFLNNAESSEVITIISLLKNMLPIHFNFYRKDIIRNDMKVDKKRLFYWLCTCRNYNVTPKQVIIQFLKSFA